jgi:4-hydroxyphenylpyruvate dioxygenase-like putative hemolysin
MKKGQKLQQNIDRVDHIAYVYRSFDRLEEARKNFSAVMGFDPDDWEDSFDDVKPSFARSVICWKAGIEFLCPVPGHEAVWIFKDLVEERGEGIAIVVMGVADLDVAKERARKAGIPILHTIEDPRHPNSEHDAHHMGEPLRRPFTIIREAIITPFNSILMAFGQIEPRNSD